MKKITFTLLLCFAVVATNAQKKNRTSAAMALKNGSYTKAKTYIDKAIAHEETKEDPKTWVYRTQICMALLGDKETEEGSKAELAKDLMISFQNAMKFDSKGEYTNDLKGIAGGLYATALNGGVQLYSEGQYEQALQSFQGSQQLAALIGIVDSAGIYNAGLAASALKNNEVAIKSFTKCTEIGYGGATPYLKLVDLYKQAGDKENAMSTLASAKEKFPNDNNILMNEISFLIDNGEAEQAEKQIQKALENDPTNTSLHYALGFVYDQKEDYDKAILAYKKALDSDKENYNYKISLGSAYKNKAAILNNKLSEIPLDAQAEYDKTITQRDENLKLCLPLLEACYKEKQEDFVKKALNESYRALKMTDKIIE